MNYPPASKASKDVANLTERKIVNEFVTLSVYLLHNWPHLSQDLIDNIFHLRHGNKNGFSEHFQWEPST